MAQYTTCLNCAVDKASCSRRNDLRQLLAGNHITSIKFQCLERKSYFSTGQRVSFDWTMWESDGYDESSLPLIFHGTVIRERGSKFVVQVDAGKDASGEGIEASDVFKKNDALLIKVRPANMKALDEPAQTVCLTCYQIAGRAESRCYKNGTDWVPNGCIGGAA